MGQGKYDLLSSALSILILSALPQLNIHFYSAPDYIGLGAFICLLLSGCVYQLQAYATHKSTLNVFKFKVSALIGELINYPNIC